jgi:hypothetical protein
LALRALPKYVVEKEEQDKVRKKIEAEIKNLKKTKKAFFRKYSGFSVSYYQVGYTPTIAKQAREIVKSGSDEDLEIFRK